MIVDEGVEDYLAALAPHGDSVLEAMEDVGRDRGFPLVGPLVGRLCSVLARSIGARRVFEMGSGFGYSTVWFARAVGPDGEVVHTDGDPDNTEEAREWLTKAGVEDRVRFHTGDALAALEGEDGPFDVIFIDVDKDAYPACWRLAAERVRPGGLILTDNVLWSGKVADDDVTDEWTQAIREYLRLATADDRFETTVVPLRDGVAVSLRLDDGD